jgi:hypothetical protein
MNADKAGTNWPPAVFFPPLKAGEGDDPKAVLGADAPPTVHPPFFPAETGRWMGSSPLARGARPDPGPSDLESITEALLERLEAWGEVAPAPSTPAPSTVGGVGGDDERAEAETRPGEPAAGLATLLETLAQELREDGGLRVSTRPDAPRLELLLRGVLMGYLLRSEVPQNPDRPR